MLSAARFYRKKACPFNEAVGRLAPSTKGKRKLALYRIIEKFSSDMARKIPLKKVCEMALDELEAQYSEEWFDFPNMTLEEQKAFDRKVLIRFFRWIRSNPVEVLEANVQCCIPEELSGEELSQGVSMIVKTADAKHQAWVISWNNMDFSNSGRSVHARTENRLEMLIPKIALEKRYPGIEVCFIRLVSNADQDGKKLSDEFRIGGTKSHHFIVTDFTDKSLDQLQECVIRAVSEPVKKDCDRCFNKALCNAPKLKITEQEVSNSFDDSCSDGVEENKRDSDLSREMKPTDEQQKVIAFRDGALRVCAPPGSGKTKVLVWRIQALIEAGVEPEQILAVTFTNKAAQEIRDRLETADSWSVPDVVTLNGLGGRIIRQNKRLLGEMKLLTPRAQKRLVGEMLSMAEPIPGFNYKVKYGYGGIINRFVALLDEWKEIGEESFIENHETEGVREPVDPAFNDFARVYFKAIKEQNYIDYEEQKSIPSRLFKEHPEILNIYQNMYRYVMVDEFQDSNRTDIEFIYQIAAHGNMMVVGDDDQGIYEFRGASSKYLLEFNKAFPNAETVVLTKNFRSTSQITDFSSCLIAGNEHRIPKNVVAVRSGVDPVMWGATDAAAIDTIVGKYLEKGYSYRDIAVIGRTNAELQKVLEQVKIPAMLAKGIFIKDPFFMFCHDVMEMLYGKNDGKRAELRLAMMLTDIDVEKTTSDNSFEFVKVRRFIERVSQLLSTTEKPAKGIETLAMLSGNMESAAYKSMLKLISEEWISDYESLASVLSEMEDSGDTGTIDREPEDKVTLITTHESKGKEWPCVIVLSADQAYKDNEGDRRLLYVAVSRAKELLYICKSSEKAQSLADSLIETA